MRWEVTEGFGATLNGEPVPKTGERQVCPPGTLVYELAVDLGTRFDTCTLEITISGGASPSEPAAPGQPACDLPGYYFYAS